jgi:hypothetical protein
MNDLLDRLTIQFLYLIFILILSVIFYYLYSLIYSPEHKAVLKKFYPSKNSAHTIHLFSRIFSLLYILGSFQIFIQKDIILSFISFIFYVLVFFTLYGISLYIFDSITLYNFEFDVEIFGRKNISYALISGSNAIAVGFIIKHIGQLSFHTLINTIFLWLLSMVLVGASIKLFPYIFNQSLNRHIVQKNTSIALTYMGFILGNTFIATSAFPNQKVTFEWYTIYVFNALLILILMTSLIFWGLKKVFKVNEDYKGDLIEETHREPQVGHGIHNAIIYFCSAYLAIIITTKINFGTFYPIINGH